MKINKVLAIAINDYEDVTLDKLQNCQKDISTIIKVLNDKYAIDDVEFISDKSETTRKALYNKLNEYFINSLEDENVLLIYAGHGEYNEHLNTAYWQPSDSDPTDSSTWLSINDIMTFIKASKAFHIGIISDSCFSGAMFEPIKRGGGIDAFNSKKSRLGLTSGGLEKVSDGHKGQSSPFAKSLTNLLEENTKEELPFSILGSNLLMQFNPKKNQTPMFGPLNDVGHQGGSFTFKLKSKQKQALKIDDKNQFLKEKLANLFIPISKDDLSIIDELEPVIKLKTKSVKNQNYEDAAKYRDEEKELEGKIRNNSSEYIDSFLSKISYSATEIKQSKELDEKITEYKTQLEKLKTNPSDEEKILAEFEKKASEGEITIENKGIYSEFIRILLRNQKPTNPAKELFVNERGNFVKAYKSNIIEIYKHIVRIKCLSESEFLSTKIEELKSALMEIYKYEIGLLIKGYRDELDEIMSIKELDVKILNWIKHK